MPKQWLERCFACCPCQGAPDWKKLRQLVGRDGDLRLSHFRRVKQLGSGDVGLVDLVQIQVRPCCLHASQGARVAAAVLPLIAALDLRFSSETRFVRRLLQGDAETRFAMKTLEKREMVERNKVRVHCVGCRWQTGGLQCQR